VLKAKHTLNKEDNTGKGKAKAKSKSKLKKDPEWIEAKKEYKAQRKVLRKERLTAKKEWREAREEVRRERRSARKEARGNGKGRGFIPEEVKPEMVWLVIENLAP
jgi:CRISPR/Cas system CSM-associated protein Csm4 (group 5 of RAMP superfamily)